MSQPYLEDYFPESTWQSLFKQNNLGQFEALWTLESEWFEPPNYRRNGWSGVIKYPLTDNHGNTIWVFIKRQENHNYKTLRHPFSGVPTFRREFINIQRLNQHNIPTLTTLYYGERQINGKSQSILVTLSLEGYESFESFFANDQPVDDRLTQKIMQLAGQHTRRLHDAHFRHGSLYPKHFFVKAEGDTVDVRFIDLEKLKWFPFAYLVRMNDLSRIIRRRAPISKQAIEILIQSYLTTGQDLQQTRLGHKLRTLLEHTD